MTSRKAVLLVASDFPGYFTRMCHALGAALREDGFQPVFLVGTHYYERFNGVDLGQLGKVYVLSDGLCAEADDSRSPVALDRWLLHATFTRSRYFLGRHPNRWQDYRRAASFIAKLFEQEPDIAAVFSELPSNATTQLVCAEATRRGVTYLGYGAARIPGHINVGLDARFTQLLANPHPPAHATVGAPDYTKVPRNMLEHATYLDLLKPRLRKLRSFPIASRERSLELGGAPQRYQAHAVLNELLRKLRYGIQARFSDVFDSTAEPSAERLDVLFPLQYRPEASTSVHARFYEDDLQTVRNIAFSLPDNARLFVKEHAAAVGVRDTAFFAALRELPGVHLLHPNWPLRDRLQVFTAVVCLTSTVGFEAIQHGVPVLLLGECFYQDYEGVTAVRSWGELEVALRALEPGRVHVPNPRPMQRYLRYCFPGHFNTLSEAIASPSNVQALLAPLRLVLHEPRMRRRA